MIGDKNHPVTASSAAILIPADRKISIPKKNKVNNKEIMKK
jgi:hypothetical protein